MALKMKPPTGGRKAAEGALRIAIVLDSYNVSAWITAVIDDLLGANFLDVAAVVVLPPKTEGPNGSFQHWLFRKYAAWDAGSKRTLDDPLHIVDAAGRFTSASEAGIPQYDSVEQLVDSALDVLIWLASREPEPAARTIARHGVWLYQQREPAHFWEIYESNPVTRSALEVLHEGADAGQVVYDAYSATVQGWSWEQNHTVPYRRASGFMLRSLRRLHECDGKGLRLIDQPLDTTERASAGSEAPSNMQVAGFLLRNAVRTVSRRVRYAGKESHWFVAYRSDRSKFISNSEGLDLRGFREIPAPDGHFYADPFLTKWQGRNYLFVEDYLFAERRGCISVMEIAKGGAISEAQRVLDLPYHLSYPFIFEHGGELFMIPETLAAGRIDLYRAAGGVTRWEFVKTLRENVDAVDTTLWIDEGCFYFFTNIAERGATVNDDLYLFHADDLLGDWKPHPWNPIVTDVRSSRGAGKLFRRNGKLMRPSQDCSVRYGYACQLSEIEILTTTEYRERPITRIEPDWAQGLIGTHTINSNEDFEVIDGQVYGKRYASVPGSGA